MLKLFIDSAWQVVVAGLILGAGLPAVFALGVRSMTVAGGGTAGHPGQNAAANRLLGAVCFVIVAVAVALGITIIVAAGVGKEVSFEHVYPTLIPKS